MDRAFESRSMSTLVICGLAPVMIQQSIRARRDRLPSEPSCSMGRFSWNERNSSPPLGSPSEVAILAWIAPTFSMGSK
eukprot:2596469-Prymnesium_polylepis.1